jgi:hypothetical protein
MTKIKKDKKRLLLIWVSVLVINCISAQERNAIIKFDGKKHDFGEINLKKDSVSEVTFSFENEGNAPLIVYSDK